jgi:hypothetical protein
VERHVCVGVRDRRTGLWVDDHPALHRQLVNAVAANGCVQAMSMPCLGERLEFEIEGGALRTSAVLDIEERDARNSMPRPVLRSRRATAPDEVLVTR